MTKSPAKPAAHIAAKTDLVAFREAWRTLAPKKRLDAILDAPDPLRVVRGLPLQDLFATLREVGPGDALEVVEMLHPRQVQGFLDLDGWRRDRLDPSAIGEWFEVLFAANPQRAAIQIRGLDIELLSLLLKLHTRVYDIASDEGPPDDDVGLHTTTPDQRYLIVYDQATAGDKLIYGLKGALELLMAKDMSFVLRLCEAIRWELPSALEEESYRFRNSRLADIGLLDAGEVHTIFAYTDPDGAFVGTPVSPPRTPVADEEGSADLSRSVLLPWDLLASGDNVVGRALAQLDPATRARVAHETMLVANRAHLAEGGDLGDPAAVQESARRTLDTVGIALSYRTKGDVSALASVLGASPVAWLFRVGISLVLRVQGELRARLPNPESGLSGNALLRLDSPLREVVAGVLRKRPLFFGGLDDADRVDFSHFRTLTDVAETARAVNEAAFRAALTGPRGLDASDAVLEAHGADPARGPSMAMMTGSALLHQMQGRPLAPLPVDAKALAAAKDALVDGHFPLALRDRSLAALGAVAKALAPLPGAPSPDEAEKRARAYADQILRAIEHELAAIDGDVDVRFVAAMWTVGNGRRALDERDDDDAQAAAPVLPPVDEEVARDLAMESDDDDDGTMGMFWRRVQGPEEEM